MSTPERQSAEDGLLVEACLQPFESLVHAGHGHVDGRELSAQTVDFSADRGETGSELLSVAAHLVEHPQDGDNEEAQQGPGLCVVHRPRIVHSPRAVERHACNYGGVG